MNFTFKIRSFASAAMVCLGLVGASSASAEELIGLTAGNTLLRFDSANPGLITDIRAVTGLQSENLIGIDYRPAGGALYGLGSARRLYTIDVLTGVASLVSPTPFASSLNGTFFGFDFNPTVDRIRLVSDAAENLRLNPNDGSLTATDGRLAYAVNDPNFGLDPRVVAAAYSNNDPTASTTALFVIDSARDILVRQNPANSGVLATVGPLGINTSELVGFDISGRSGSAYASLTSPGGLSSLYSINLGTGAASLLGNINSPNALIGLAAPVPEPTTVALVGLGGLTLLALRRKR